MCHNSPPFDAPTAIYSAFYYGDSLTQGSGDDTPPPLGSNGLPRYMSSLPTLTVREVPTRVGVSGANTATMKARVDADLAAAVGVPDYVIIQIGTNDIKAAAAANNATTWKTNYAYILDAMHTKWPSAKVYCFRVWASPENGDMSNVDDTWIPDVLSTRSSWAFFGTDERTILPTNNAGDGLHPNHAGYVLIAASMRTVMGL